MLGMNSPALLPLLATLVITIGVYPGAETTPPEITGRALGATAEEEAEVFVI